MSEAPLFTREATSLAALGHCRPAAAVMLHASNEPLISWGIFPSLF